MSLRPEPDEYEAQQDLRDRQYQQAWDAAPESFRKQAAARGLTAEVERPGMAMEFEENYLSASYTPDMEALDTSVDRLIEKHGTPNESLIRSVAESLRIPMLMEIERNRALMLGRVACYLVNSAGANILARVHALFHAIPRLAATNGFSSLRDSARAAGVSPEWMRKSRDLCCQELGIPIPKEGTKSIEAKEKYRDNALTNHHRKQTYRPKCKPNLPNLPKCDHCKVNPATTFTTRISGAKLLKLNLGMACANPKLQAA